MSIPFFKAVLKALGKSLNYTAIVNLYGNAFAKDASSIVEQANPLHGDYKEATTGLFGLFTNPGANISSNMQGIEWAVG